MNVLVTGVGAIIGQGIIKSLHAAGFSGNIHGMDIYAHAYGQTLCQKFHLAPRADAPNFVERMNAMILDHKIDLILPGIEQDLYRLHAERDKLKCDVVMNNDLLIGLSKDKWATYKFFEEASEIDLIPTSELADFESLKKSLGLPFVLKPKFSYASKGLFIINSQEEFLLHAYGTSGVICQKRISSVEGEFTVHLFGDGAGNVLDILAMKRLLGADGATGVAEYSEDSSVLNACRNIAKLTKPLGPTNIQLIKEDGRALLLEINPRFSSACSIATLMGYNAPAHSISYFIEKAPLKICKKSPRKVVRHIEDWVFSEANT